MPTVHREEDLRETAGTETTILMSSTLELARVTGRVAAPATAPSDRIESETKGIGETHGVPIDEKEMIAEETT